MVKVTQGDLRRQRAEVMKLAQHRDISKKWLEELPWSTGLLDIWRDPELLSMSSQGFRARSSAQTNAHYSLQQAMCMR